MQIAHKLSSLWRRRSVRDAAAVAGVCFAIYVAANTFNIFDRTYAFAKAYENYEVDDLIVVAVALGFLMLVYALRRAQDLKSETHKREQAEKKNDDHAMQLAMAVNNMPQGIVLFDASEHLVVCNNHYLQMYGLSANVVKPGASMLTVFQHSSDIGLLRCNPEEYRAELRTLLAQKKVVHRIVETSDGREIAVTDYPMADGGWVATHEDRTEFRRREESFRLLFDNNPVAMWVFDRKTLRFLAVNDAAVLCYGYSREQFLAMTVADLRFGDKEKSAAFIRALPADPHDGYIIEHRRADGTIINVSIFSRVLNYHGRDARMAAISDITARKQAEDELRRTKMFVDTVIENVPMPIFVKNTNDNRLTLMNRASEDLFGIKRDEIIGKTVHEIYDKERADSISVWDKECLLSGKTIVIPDHVVPTPKGLRTLVAKKLVIQDPDGKPEILLTLIDDVTERRQAEQRVEDDRAELRRREESFRLMFDNNPIAMWVSDCETLRFLAVNDAALDCYGYSREQFLELTIPDLRPGDKDESAMFIHALPARQHDGYIAEHRRADGKTINVSIYSRVLNYHGREARLAAASDITARMQAEGELRRTKVFLDTVIENLPMPMVVKTTRDGRFTLINKASEDLHGYKREDIIGKTLYDIFPKERADQIAAQDQETFLSDRPVVIGDHTLHTPKGARLITSRKSFIPGDDGKPEYLVTMIEDVTERREAEQRIEHMAHSDPLTDLPNRSAFSEHLSATLKLAAEEHRSFAVLCMDLDGFKEVNDVYGHAVGDELLCRVADRLRAVAGDIFVARLGGDEFTIIAANAEGTKIAQLADRLLAAFIDDFEVDGHCLPQGLSIGIAVYPADGIDSKTLLSNADAALYQAKAGTPGSFRFYEAEMGTRLREQSLLQIDLNAAIERNELGLHYQPQLKMSGEITGLEALARWYSPKRGMVSPAEFIPLAEESGLILVIGEWVLREACREAASWPKPLHVAVNVSPVQFRQGDLPRLVHSILLETGLPAHRLELEITEGVLIDDFSRAVSILHRLKSLGVRIVLDDFGTGYSSLSYLRAFNFDKIKIDSSFVCDLARDHQSLLIVRAVIGLGRSLSIPILAEGVETQVQHALLAQEGCDEVQGYLTGRPLAIADYAEVVGRKATAARLARAV